MLENLGHWSHFSHDIFLPQVVIREYIMYFEGHHLGNSHHFLAPLIEIYIVSWLVFDDISLLYLLWAYMILSLSSMDMPTSRMYFIRIWIYFLVYVGLLSLVSLSTLLIGLPVVMYFNHQILFYPHTFWGIYYNSKVHLLWSRIQAQPFPSQTVKLWLVKH